MRAPDTVKQPQVDGHGWTSGDEAGDETVKKDWGKIKDHGS